MKYVPGYLDSFISPVTGNLSGNNGLPLTEDYILVGAHNGYSIASPIMIDVRLELIALRNLLATAKFLLQQAQTGLDEAQDLSLVRNGMISVSNGVIVPTNLTHNNFWIGDINNFPVETTTLPSAGLPDLTLNNVWIGNAFNRPVETLFNIMTGTGLTGGPIIGSGTIDIANTGITAGSYAYASINVNAQGQLLNAVDNSSQISSILSNLADLASIVSALTSTVNALSAAVNAIETGIASIGGFAAILLLQAQVLGLIGAVASLSSRMDSAENNINTINGEIATINATIAALRLNNIPASADVSIYNFKLINVADPTNPQDAATKHYVDNAISGIPGSIIITLAGAVSGSGPSNTTINTISTGTFILQTTDSSLPNAQVLASLSSGIVKNTTSTGVLSIATPGTDYYSPGHPTTLIDDFTLNVNPVLSYGNLGVGTRTLASLTLGSSSNTFNLGIGQQSLYSFTTGVGNTAIGLSTLYSLVSGNTNTVGGPNSLILLASGNDNTVWGAAVAQFMTNGSSNSFYGSQVANNSLANNLTGCCLFGFQSNPSTSGISYASAFGYQTQANTQGSSFGAFSTASATNSSAFGYQASANTLEASAFGALSIASATNATALGYNVNASHPNTVILGNGANVGIGTNNPLYPLDVIGVSNIAINVNTSRIINVNTPISSLDAVNKNYVDTKPLNTFPVTGNLDMGGYSIQNLAQSPIATLDAISAQFLWDLIHDKVSVTWM